ncbi:acetate kinase [Bradyrhizobium embrapense]
MSDSVLVLNAGSSSTKFGLFDITPAEPKLQCRACSMSRRRSHAS